MAVDSKFSANNLDLGYTKNPQLINIAKLGVVITVIEATALFLLYML